MHAHKCDIMAAFASIIGMSTVAQFTVFEDTVNVRDANRPLRPETAKGGAALCTSVPVSHRLARYSGIDGTKALVTHSIPSRTIIHLQLSVVGEFRSSRQTNCIWKKQLNAQIANRVLPRYIDPFCLAVLLAL